MINLNFNFLNYFYEKKLIIFLFIFFIIYLNDLWGIGDWGLGIGDWGLGIGPNPQYPITNPQYPIPIKQIN